MKSKFTILKESLIKTASAMKCSNTPIKDLKQILKDAKQEFKQKGVKE